MDADTLIVTDQTYGDGTMENPMYADDPHAAWMRNIARMMWVFNGIYNRNISGGDYNSARDMAVKAFVRLRQVMGEKLEISPKVYVTPDYASYRDTRTFRLYLNVCVDESNENRVTGITLTDTTVELRTDMFNIVIPIQMTADEVAEMERFRELTAKVDPLSGAQDAP